MIDYPISYDNIFLHVLLNALTHPALFCEVRRHPTWGTVVPCWEGGGAPPTKHCMKFVQFLYILLDGTQQLFSVLTNNISIQYTLIQNSKCSLEYDQSFIYINKLDFLCSSRVICFRTVRRGGHWVLF